VFEKATRITDHRCLVDDIGPRFNRDGRSAFGAIRNFFGFPEFVNKHRSQLEAIRLRRLEDPNLDLKDDQMKIFKTHQKIERIEAPGLLGPLLKRQPWIADLFHEKDHGKRLDIFARSGAKLPDPVSLKLEFAD
jgi:hypothetical protein